MLFIVCLIVLVSQSSLFQAYGNVQQRSTGEKVGCRKYSSQSSSVPRNCDMISSFSHPLNGKLPHHFSKFRQGGKLTRNGRNRRIQRIRTSNTNPFFNDAEIVSENDERLMELNMTVCGNTPLTITDRIINGKEAARGEHCYIAQLYYQLAISSYYYYYYRSETSLTSLCAGSLIQSHWVLTAAHCIDGHYADELKYVHLGEHNTGTNPDCYTQPDDTLVCSPPVQICDVVKKIQHPQFDGEALVNDIALIKLNESARINQETICLVCIPVGSNQFYTGENSILTVVGWGATESSASSEVLMTVDVPYVDLETCWSSCSLETHSPCVICAGGGDEDSCTGDSGSSLTTWLPYDETDDDETYTVHRLTQLGIVSYGPSPCGTNGEMGVYTFTGCYPEFMLSTMMEHQNDTSTRQRNYNVRGRG